MSDIQIQQYKNDRLSITMNDPNKYGDTFKNIGARFNSKLNSGLGGWTIASKKNNY